MRTDRPSETCVPLGRTANVFWSGCEAAISAVLSFASAFIVARLIGPTEVGVGAAAVAVHVLLWVAVNALFADALVQRDVVDDEAFSSALLASTLIGCLAALLQVALGYLLAWSLVDVRLIAMSAALAVALPLVGSAGPVQGKLTRERAYRKLAARTVVGQGLGTLAGVAGAFWGAGAWALVIQQVVGSSTGGLALLICCRMPPCRRVCRRRLRELLRIGLPITASALVASGRYRLFALLVGGTAGTATLGQVHMAFRLVDAVRELALTAQWRLMLPLLSERQHDLPSLGAAMDRCLAWSSLFAFPLCATMAVAMQPLVAMLLGPAWQPSGEAALPLIALAAWLFLTFPAAVAVVARGKPRYPLIANIAGTITTGCGILLLHPTSPLQAVLVWVGAQMFVSPVMMHTYAHVLHTTPSRLVRAGVPWFAASLLATAGAFVMPQLIGGPASPTWLLAARLCIVAAIGIPLVVAMAAPTGLFSSVRLQR